MLRSCTNKLRKFILEVKVIKCLGTVSIEKETNTSLNYGNTLTDRDWQWIFGRKHWDREQANLLMFDLNLRPSFTIHI